MSGAQRKQPEIIDAEWEPAPGEPPPRPKTFIESIIDDSDRIARDANQFLDELGALRDHGHRLVGNARGLFRRVARNVEFRVGERKLPPR